MRISSKNLFLVFLLPLLLSAQADRKLVEKISDDSYRVDNILINSKEKTISFPAWVNIDKGLIEVMVCAPGGKDHESVFIANIVPSYLNTALLMLGVERNNEISYDLRKPNIVGPSIDVIVKWKENGESKEVEAEKFLINSADSSVVQNIDWVYTGSFSRDGHYAADKTKSIITTYNDLTTIIDNGSKSGVDDTLFEANPKIIPPVKSDVIIIIKLNRDN